MADRYSVLILGASYGSLLAIKLLAAGHTVKLACLPAEADLINLEGARVRMPVKGREGLVEVDSRQLPGRLSAGAPRDLRIEGHDLAVLAMQEPQYRAPEVRELLRAIVAARVPCMSIMNMPPLPYLARIPGVDVAVARAESDRIDARADVAQHRGVPVRGEARGLEIRRQAHLQDVRLFVGRTERLRIGAA